MCCRCNTSHYQIGWNVSDKVLLIEKHFFFTRLARRTCLIITSVCWKTSWRPVLIERNGVQQTSHACFLTYLIILPSQYLAEQLDGKKECSLLILSCKPYLVWLQLDSRPRTTYCLYLKRLLCRMIFWSLKDKADPFQEVLFHGLCSGRQESRQNKLQCTWFWIHHYKYCTSIFHISIWTNLCVVSAIRRSMRDLIPEKRMAHIINLIVL